MKKLFTVLLVLSLISVGSVFAGGGRDASGQAPLIGVAMPETHVERWIKDGASLVEQAQRRGFRAQVQFGDGDQTIQNRQIQSFITQGASALIIGNISEGVASVVNEAHREGITVVAYDRIIQGTHNYGYFITFNNYKVGTLQAESLVRGMNLDQATAANPKHITLFAGSPTDANANFFFQGAIDVLLPYIDRGVLRVVGPFPRHYREPAFQQIATEGWDAARAKARMEGLLIGAAAGVTLDAVLAPNDTLAIAIIEALRADARYRTSLPIISGQDAQPSSWASINRGEQYSTIFKDTAKLAEAAVLLTEQVLRGQAIRIPGAVLAAGDLTQIAFTGTGYVTTYLLDPVLVTRENLNVPVQAGFYSDAERSQHGIR